MRNIKNDLNFIVGGIFTHCACLQEIKLENLSTIKKSWISRFKESKIFALFNSSAIAGKSETDKIRCTSGIDLIRPDGRGRYYK